MFRPTIYPSQQKFTRAALGLLGTFCMSDRASQNKQPLVPLFVVLKVVFSWTPCIYQYFNVGKQGWRMFEVRRGFYIERTLIKYIYQSFNIDNKKLVSCNLTEPVYQSWLLVSVTISYYFYYLVLPSFLSPCIFFLIPSPSHISISFTSSSSDCILTDPV